MCMKSIFNFLPKAKIKICIPNEPEPSSVTIIGLNLIYTLNMILIANFGFL